jgi:fibronectin-binding autotransporter adhesin
MKPTRLSLLRAASAMALVTSPALHAASGTWNVDANGNWSLATNWAGSVIADASSFSANFTFNITADRTVTLDTSRTLTGLVFTDLGTASHNWILTRSGTAVLTLAGVGPSINVTNRSATVSAVIGGNTGWTKSGAGTLTLSGVNTSTGNIALSGGVLAATMGNGLTGPLGSSTNPATASKQLTITNNAVFRSLAACRT